MPTLNGNALHRQSQEYGDDIYIGGQPQSSLAKKIFHDHFWQGVHEEGWGFIYIPEPIGLNFGVNDPNINVPPAVTAEELDDEFDFLYNPDAVQTAEIILSNNIDYLFQAVWNN